MSFTAIMTGKVQWPMRISAMTEFAAPSSPATSFSFGSFSGLKLGSFICGRASHVTDHSQPLPCTRTQSTRVSVTCDGCLHVNAVYQACRASLWASRNELWHLVCLVLPRNMASTPDCTYLPDQLPRHSRVSWIARATIDFVHYVHLLGTPGSSNTSSGNAEA